MLLIYSGSKEDFYGLTLSISDMCFFHNISVMLMLDELTVLAGKTVIAHKDTIKKKPDYIGGNEETILTLIKRENAV